MMKQISQYLEKIENATPRTVLITGFLSGVGIDPEGIRLWAVKKIIEFLRIGENTGASRILNIALLLLELFFILVTIAQVIKTEPIGWICALLGFFSGFTSTNIYLGLSFLALGIYILRCARAFLDEIPCKLRDWLTEEEAPPKMGEGWFCLKKAPTIKKLGSGIAGAARKICQGCQIREGALEDSRILREQKTLGRVVPFPRCKRGAKLNEDMTELYCPEIGKWRPIKERKKKKDPQPCHARGSLPYRRCPEIEWTQIVIKGELPEPEK